MVQINKDQGQNQKLQNLTLLYAAMQNRSIRSHKKLINNLKSEERGATTQEFSDHIKKMKEFIGTIQTKDKIIEKISKDNVSKKKNWV